MPNWSIVTGLFALALCFPDGSTLANAAYFKPETMIGIGEPVFENSFPVYDGAGRLQYPALHAAQQVEAIIALRPSLVRLWVPVGYFLVRPPDDATPDPTAEANIARMRAILAAFRAAKVSILGVDHSFPRWMTQVPVVKCAGLDVNWNAIPRRNLVTGSPYRAFLANFQATWNRLATLFPEVEAWEPANETNGALSLVPAQDGDVCPQEGQSRSQFSWDERILITLDLMGSARIGLKAGNPEAVVVTPPAGPVTPADGINPARTLAGIARFIDALYAGIAAGSSATGSHDARDYFDAVSWHPYIFQDASEVSWVLPNEAIHDVLVRHGDEGVPVFLSEIGNSDVNWSHERRGVVPVSEGMLAEWMRNTLALTRERLRWVTAIVWFRAFDSDRAAAWGGEHQRRFGVLRSPAASDGRFAPKASAREFCAATLCEVVPR